MCWRPNRTSLTGENQLRTFKFLRMEARFMLITFHSYFCLQQVSLPNGHSVAPFLGWVSFNRNNSPYYYSALEFNPFSAITMLVFPLRGGNPFAMVKLRPTITNDRSAPIIWWEFIQPLPRCEVMSSWFCLYWRIVNMAEEPNERILLQHQF